MKKLLVITTALIALGSVSANAANISLSIGAPAYYEPAPVYPAPVYVAPEPVYPEYVGGYYHVRPVVSAPRHRQYDWRYWHDHGHDDNHGHGHDHH